MTKRSSAHEFALFFPHELADTYKDHEWQLSDKALMHRITHVLRLTPDESFIAFNHRMHARCQIVRATKKELVLRTQSIDENQQVRPQFTFFLPLLKKEALEHTIYGLTALGVNEVQLIITQKVQRAWGGERELERLVRVMIAACEQSKYYAGMQIYPPITFDTFNERICGRKPFFYFDALGAPLHAQWHSLHGKQHELYALIGPEGDLTDAEKERVIAHGALKSALTATILEAQQAALLGAGALRIFANQ